MEIRNDGRVSLGPKTTPELLPHLRREPLARAALLNRLRPPGFARLQIRQTELQKLPARMEEARQSQP